MAKKGKKGWSHCFHGVIHREKDENGKETAVNSKISLPGRIHLSRDVNRDRCGENSTTWLSFASTMTFMAIPA